MCGNGCDGGEPLYVWQYFYGNGIPSEACSPYAFPKCAHHVNSTKYPPCKDIQPTPSCDQTCKDDEDYTSDRYYASSTYSVSSESKIMQELVSRGPVTAAFTVYADFPTYKSGVYRHVTGQALGGHAIKIIGYGVENGTPYWEVNNSWNETWGDHGTFKILRGSDECGIESNVVAGLAKVPS